MKVRFSVRARARARARVRARARARARARLTLVNVTKLTLEYFKIEYSHEVTVPPHSTSI